MTKQFMGLRLRRLREEQSLTQADLARQMGISPSYLNQIEQNQRPLTVPVLLKLNAALDLDVQVFAEGDSARRMQDLRAVMQDQGRSLSQVELRALAHDMPDVADSLIELHSRLREQTERADLLATRVTEPGAATSPAAFETVRDWFGARRNHVDPLDRAGEAIGADFSSTGLADGLIARLSARHGIRVNLHATGARLRSFEASERILHLSETLSPGQQAFQIATQICLLEQSSLLDQLVATARPGPEAQGLLRIGLANYFAGAVLMPYQRFLSAAEESRYDIEILGRRFGLGFETICHRLSTLQRPGAEGVPFFFIRVDRAGNISKRQSATDFHFSRIGGSCPLWTIYDAFSRPGEILRQIAQMPDGRSYLWLATALHSKGAGFGAARKSFAIALGCDLSHADRLAYAQGLDLGNPDLSVKIGPGCKLCDRSHCPQRAFPAVGRSLRSNPAEAFFTPYIAAET